MALPLDNRTIALAEGRQLEELAQMLEKEGARTLRCPLLSILDTPDEKPVLEWLQRLTAGKLDWVILFTGEGVARLLALADRHGLREAVIAALSKVQTVTRGPKPVKAMKEAGLTPTRMAQAPTTEGIIASLHTIDLHSKTVGVQMYSDANPPLMQYLQEAGAVADPVQPYVYAPDSDGARVAELIQEMAAGRIDAIVFTSSPQVDRLFGVAAQREMTATLHEGFMRTQVASVGPILSEHLRSRDVPVHIAPEQGFVMKNLVQQIKRALGSR